MRCKSLDDGQRFRNVKWLMDRFYYIVSILVTLTALTYWEDTNDKISNSFLNQGILVEKVSSSCSACLC